MSTNLDLKAVLDFLSQLKTNNNKAWFDQHRAEYELARQQFESLVAGLIDGFSAFEPLGGITPKDCVMRIYRDIRFSPDKSPYRTNLAASIGPGGRKSSRLAYYFQLGPGDETMLAGGLHEPTPEHLARFRSAIDRDATTLEAVTGAPEFKRYYGAVTGERVKTAPQGYSRDHPEIETLRLKQVVAIHNWPDEEVLRPEFREDVVAAARALKPFLDYLNATVQG